MSGKATKVDSPTPSPRSLAMKSVSTCTSVGTVTEPDCLGPCEPGTSVTLEGIVWQETEGGVLVVNVTWRGKTYVGTLLDCTKHDWAPPRFCESPTSDIELKANKVSRTKRNRGSTVDTSLDLRNVPSKLRNGKGRRTANSGFTVPASPVKCEASPNVNSKRKTRLDLEFSPISDSNKNAKKNRSQSRNTPTPGTPTSDSPSPQSSFNAWIECPEPNCNKKYKHISGLKYHQKAHRRSANDSSTEFYKPDADMMETESQRESIPTSDGEEAHQEDASVPPSPSFKFVLKSKLGVVDSTLPNSIEGSIGSFEPDSSSSFENTIDGKEGTDPEENSNPSKSSNGLFSSSHAHQSHGSGVISSTDPGVSQASTSGKVSATSGNSSNHSATFLVPASSQVSSVPPSSNAKISSSIVSRAQEKSKIRGEKCYSGDKFYKVTPGPSGLSISVSPLLSNNNSSSPKRSSSTLDLSFSKSEKQLDSSNVKHKKHQKHKKKKKDKDKDRDRDREKEKKGSSSVSSPGMNKPLPVCFNVRNSNDEESPDPLDKDANSNPELPVSDESAPSNNVPPDTIDILKSKTSESSIDGSLEDATAKKDSEILDRDPFENVQSPAYSDISDANDTEVEIKPVSNKDDVSESSCVAPMDLPNFPRSSGFGMYPFFNQPSFVSSDQHSNQDPLEKTRISNQPPEPSNQPLSQNFYQQNQLQEQTKTSSHPSSSPLGKTSVSQAPCPRKTVSSSDIKRNEASLASSANVTIEKSSSPAIDGIASESQTNNREVPSSQPNFPSQPSYQYSPYSFIQGLCIEPSYMHPMNMEQRYSKMGDDKLQREMSSKHLNNATKTQSLVPKKPESPSDPNHQSSVSSKNVFSHFDPSTHRNSSPGSEKVFVEHNKEMNELPAGLASRLPGKMNLNISSQTHHGIARPGFSGLSFDNLFDKSKLEQKNFSSVDLEKIGSESQNKVSLTGPPPLRRDDLTLPRDSKADQIRPLSSVVDPSLASKLSPICTQSSVMSSSSDPASSSISSPKFSVNLPPIIPSSSSNHPISTNVKDSHRRDKNTDEGDRKTKLKEEGVKPTMETTGPPPPPTNSYYLPPQYLQHPVHSFAHMPFEHGPSLFRPGHMGSPVLSNPYGPPSPYLHPQLRYHLGPSSSGPVDLPSRPPSSAPSSNDIGSKASEPSKSMDILHQVSQHYQSHHKIHELHDRAITSPSVPKSASPNISSNGPRGLPSLKTPASDDGPQIEGKGDLSRSPPPQRHLHTHHHTHVGYPGVPIYDPYRALIASQHAAATGINPFVPK
ncbi:uncharacterized protein LOC141852316 [Brevipalpus obovatus]|uniref:uncharacterized protein LOC141852316 n=1 Tax=Brevipalpus obovatus TaxID=246614 RepID=UPI003D9FA90B